MLRVRGGTGRLSKCVAVGVFVVVAAVAAAPVYAKPGSLKPGAVWQSDTERLVADMAGYSISASRIFRVGEAGCVGAVFKFRAGAKNYSEARRYNLSECFFVRYDPGDYSPDSATKTGVLEVAVGEVGLAE